MLLRLLTSTPRWRHLTAALTISCGRYFKKESKLHARQATRHFNSRLSRQNHAGELHFDHDNESLQLEVRRNAQDSASAATADARGLSGGERSFTTLAFELAMWEFCATPFRVLDEFDVYMDDTYRKQAVEVRAGHSCPDTCADSRV